jgi:hypothetical protein
MRPLQLAAIAAASLFLSLTGAGCSDDSFDRTYDVEAYALTGEFDWESQRLRATVAISLTLGDESPRVLELDSDVAVSAVRLAGAGPVAFRSLEDPGRLVVSLAEAGDIPPGKALTLEIDYEAPASKALRAVPPREGDPLPIRALYTDSEPLGAPAWMPCNNRPSDRALFSVSMRMDPAETMVSNGVLTEDVEESDGARRIRYETGYTLPTYLMAFAISDFEVKAASDTDVPIAIWHRRGLPGSHDAMLSELDRMINLFEGLLGPYPFERYSLVLLPGFPGGMENAGITFQREVGSTEPALAGDLTLAAHELAHQWVGDLVTVETWDDVWIKEGMATLLEYEAARDHIDASGAGTLNGDELAPEDGVPIRDRDAPPLRKYTSGPYSRAAWLLTQIRSLTGDEAFFAAIRGVLEKNRFGSVGTDEFLNAFGPALGPEALERARRAVDARAMPRLSLALQGEASVLVTLTDPDGALVAPMDYAWITASGAPQTETLSPGAPASLARGPDDILLVLDPADRHPDWQRFPLVEGLVSASGVQYNSIDVYRNEMILLRSPPPGGLASFLELPGPHQRAVLAYNNVLDWSNPGSFGELEAALSSDAAKILALERACSPAIEEDSSDPDVTAAWASALKPMLAGSPALFGLAYLSRFYDCSELATKMDLFAEEWASLDDGLAPGEIPDLRLAYLAKFTRGGESELAGWGSVATEGPTLRARAVAAEHLARRFLSEDPPAHAFFVNLMRSSEASEVLRWGITGLLRTAPDDGSGDAQIFEVLRGVLASAVPRSVHTQAICAAYSVARHATFPNGEGSEPVWVVDPAWDDLVRDLESAPIASADRAYLTDPALCL